MGNVNLSDLLRYKKEVQIADPRTGKSVATVWLRVLGDLDLQRAYKTARLASANKRMALRNPETEDYQDEVIGISDLSIEEQKDLIRTARLSNIVSEANVVVTRPDLPKLEEVSVEPDAATLEELEKLDRLEIETEEEYQKKIDDYIESRTQALLAELDNLSEEDLLKQAKEAVSEVIPFSVFITELNALKIYYGAFQEKECRTRVFSSVDDFKQLPKPVQEKLVEEMNSLEISGPEIKN